MQPFGNFATDHFVSRHPELSSHRSVVIDAAFSYLFRFDNTLSNEFIQSIISTFVRLLADLVGWSEAESRRVALRHFHDASRRYFASNWRHVSAFTTANAEALRLLRRRHARRFDIILNGIGPNESGARQVDSAALDAVLARASPAQPVIVKVFADYCSNCLAMAPAFEAAARALYPAPFVAIDGAKNVDAARRLNVVRFPAIMKFTSQRAPDNTYAKRSFSEEEIVEFAIGSAVQNPVLAGGVEGEEELAADAERSASPVEEALAFAAAGDPDPSGAQFGVWASMLRQQGIDQLEALVADRDAAMQSNADSALACDSEDVCSVSGSGWVDNYDSTIKPVVILLGGGMGSGKTSSMASLAQTAFWKERGPSVVVVEADKFKKTDPMFTALNSIGVEAAPAVHPKSVEVAENLFLKAVQARRNVVMDGTLSWKPYVEQTITMLRDTKYFYTRGPGYVRRDDGSLLEQYWVRGDERQEQVPAYHIEIVGVTVSPAVAVERGIVRKIISGRGVPVENQLASHKQFSENFESYAELVDGIYLFDSSIEAHNDHLRSQSKDNSEDVSIVASKRNLLFRKTADFADGVVPRDYVVERPEAYQRFLRKTTINCKADCSSELWL